VVAAKSKPITKYAKAFPSEPERGIALATDRILRAENVPPEHVIDPRTAFVMTGLLRDVVRYGTGARANVLGRPTAGKTGTTNDEMDAWFMGFTPDLVAGVWVGNDEKKSLGRRETGGRAAAPIWVEFMQAATSDLPARDFPVPPGIVFQRIDRQTGLLACPDTEQPVFVPYKQGTEPKEYACQKGTGVMPMDSYTNTQVPQGLPPAGVPMGLPPQ
jgi:penicillin-binding protein 1A